MVVTIQVKSVVVYFLLLNGVMWKFLTVVNGIYSNYLEREHYNYNSCKILDDVDARVFWKP